MTKRLSDQELYQELVDVVDEVWDLAMYFSKGRSLPGDSASFRENVKKFDSLAEELAERLDKNLLADPSHKVSTGLFSKFSR